MYDALIARIDERIDEAAYVRHSITETLVSEIVPSERRSAWAIQTFAMALAAGEDLDGVARARWVRPFVDHLPGVRRKEGFGYVMRTWYVNERQALLPELRAVAWE